MAPPATNLELRFSDFINQRIGESDVPLTTSILQIGEQRNLGAACGSPRTFLKAGAQKVYPNSLGNAYAWTFRREQTQSWVSEQAYDSFETLLPEMSDPVAL